MFKIGQLITGTPESDDEYSVTTSRAIMRVLTVRDPRTIEVEIIAARHPDFIDQYSELISHPYAVSPTFFRPYNQFIFTRTTQCQELHEDLV